MPNPPPPPGFIPDPPEGFVHDSPSGTDASSLPVRYPSEVPSRLATGAMGIPGFIKRNIVPAGAMGAAGLALDAALPEGGIPLSILEGVLRAGVGGATNVAVTKKLPPSLGGEPTMPAGKAFLYGAAPEALMAPLPLARGIARGKLNRAAAQGTERIAQRMTPDAPEVAQGLLAPRSMVPFGQPLSGARLTDATNAARAPVQATIAAARNKYGAPLGRAYETLKGAQPLTPDEATQLGEGAQRVLTDMTSSANPQTRSFATKLGAMTAEDPHSANIARDMRAQHFTEPQIKDYLASQRKGEPVTLDDLRKLWQQMGAAQARAGTTADAHGLGQLRDLLEDHLNEHLGPEWSELRKQYRGFKTRWSHRDEAALSNLGTPQEVADWTFQKPEYAHDLLSEAQSKLEQLDQLRGLFIQHIYGPLNDTTMSEAQQVSAVRKNLAPYFKSPETARLLFGDRPSAKMAQMLAWPKDVANFQQRMKNPRFKQQFSDGVKVELLNDRRATPDQAGERMLTQMQRSNPEFASQILPQLPPPETAVRKNPMGMRTPIYHGMMAAGALGSAAMGHPTFALEWQATALGAWFLASRAGSFKAASSLGITAPMLRAMRSGGYMAGKQAARAFLNAGARYKQEQNVEMGDAPNQEGQ